MVGAGIAATQALRRAGIEVDLDGTSEAERRFAEQFRDGEFVQVGGPGLAVSAADGG